MAEEKIRVPVVSGQFYPSNPTKLKEQIATFLPQKSQKSDAIACMLPHAGYAYSGRVAVETCASIDIKDKIILLGPNHTGYGCAFSIMAKGTWKTPLGDVKIDSVLSDRLLKRSKILKEDDSAHAQEHSLEVELPILQYFKKSFEIVPITILSDSFVLLKGLGQEIADLIREIGTKDSVLIVASSDMTHYEPQSEAQAKDEEAIKAILELDAEKLMHKIKGLEISMCGCSPAAAMLIAAKALGATKARLIRYQTSGDVTGDKDSVVGYAGIIIS